MKGWRDPALFFGLSLEWNASTQRNNVRVNCVQAIVKRCYLSYILFRCMVLGSSDGKMNKLYMLYRQISRHYLRTQLIMLLVITLCSASPLLSQDCKKCDIVTLTKISKNIDQLNLEIVKEFVCSFDSSCNSNIEYSEWSNELLFQVMNNDIDLLNKAIHELGYNYVKFVASKIEFPIHEFDYQKLYSIVKNSWGPKDIVESELQAIELAASRAGQEIAK